MTTQLPTNPWGAYSTAGPEYDRRWRAAMSKGHIERKAGELFIKRCKHCHTRTYNRVEADGSHRCVTCGKVNLKA